VAQVDTRQRAGYLFGAIVIGHILLISAQVPSKGGVPMLEAVVFGVFAQVQRASSTVFSTIRHGWSGYVGLRGVSAENEQLRRDLAEARIQLQEQRALADRSRGLERLLGFRDSLELKTTAARVIAAGAAPEFRTLTIDKGSGDGIRTDMSVLAPDGVVGRVVVPSGSAAKVQLLIDRNAAAGAIIERSRAQGVAVGSGDGLLRLDYVSEVSELAVGDTVVTSGIDGIYPKGFVIGRVQTVEKSGGAYKRIVVRPAVDFNSLEDVLVVLTPPPAAAAAESRR